MEGIFFLLDIFCMLMLCIAICRGEDEGGDSMPGLFAYKEDSRVSVDERIPDDA